MSGPSPQEIEGVLDRFRYHAPSSAQVGRAHENARMYCRELAEWVMCHLPETRHRSLALTALQETMMWINATISIDGLPGEDPT